MCHSIAAIISVIRWVEIPFCALLLLYIAELVDQVLVLLERQC